MISNYHCCLVGDRWRVKKNQKNCDVENEIDYKNYVSPVWIAIGSFIRTSERIRSCQKIRYSHSSRRDCRHRTSRHPKHRGTRNRSHRRSSIRRTNGPRHRCCRHRYSHHCRHRYSHHCRYLHRCRCLLLHRNHRSSPIFRMIFRKICRARGGSVPIVGCCCCCYCYECSRQHPSLLVDSIDRTNRFRWWLPISSSFCYWHRRCFSSSRLLCRWRCTGFAAFGIPRRYPFSGSPRCARQNPPKPGKKLGLLCVLFSSLSSLLMSLIYDDCVTRVFLIVSISK